MSPRTRLGSGASVFDGILNGTDNAWPGMKRRTSVGQPSASRADEAPETPDGLSIKEEEADDAPPVTSQQPSTSASLGVGQTAVSDLNSGVEALSLNANTAEQQPQPQSQDSNGTQPSTTQPSPVPLEKVLWSYIDFQGATQGTRNSQHNVCLIMIAVPYIVHRTF